VAAAGRFPWFSATVSDCARTEQASKWQSTRYFGACAHVAPRGAGCTLAPWRAFSATGALRGLG